MATMFLRASVFEMLGLISLYLQQSLNMRVTELVYLTSLLNSQGLMSDGLAAGQ